MVDAVTENESWDGSHGSTFTVLLPLGKDHLPAAHVDDTMSEQHRHQHYARGIVEEATQWASHGDPHLVKTPSDTSDSSGSEGKVDAMFFMKKDVLLLGIWPRTFVKDIVLTSF